MNGARVNCARPDGARASAVASAVLCCLTLSACAADVASAEEKRALPGTTYESLRDLPDWNGWWGIVEPQSEEFVRLPPPMKSGSVARFKSVRAQDSDPDPNRYCRPSQFVGYSGGFAESVEFLFTPGRITLTNESGLIRRIYTDGTPLPRDPDETATGTSVGHWEGATLVVETVGIKSTALFPAPLSGALPIGKNASVTERISLTPEKTLQFEIVTVAPDILVAPDRRKRVYSRVPKRLANEITFCTDHDRAIDPTTGKQRFDMTPPANIPPPPPP